MISAVLPTYSRADLEFVKGEGAWLTEADGSHFLDLASGIAVNSLGHAHPDLVQVIKSQAEKLWHSAIRFFLHLRTCREGVTPTGPQRA